ncbi:unnamed protein product [Paramecium sonneborni]|uniref:Uncharacterized protein n=1 Tax=Paramecium sonneborni TaxID=65129 RepID=A0A8S1Q4W2_9CILI|nr:unnamed protein product [Paramecium sonneborni]
MKYKTFKYKFILPQKQKQQDETWEYQKLNKLKGGKNLN